MHIFIKKIHWESDGLGFSASLVRIMIRANVLSNAT